MKGIDNAVLAIYNSFKYGLFDEMRRHKLEKCRFVDYHEFPVTGRFCFKANTAPWDGTVCNIAITIDKFGYKYYDELVDIFKSHADWLFEISGYHYHTDTFDIVFKRPIYDGVEKEAYRISTYGIIADDYFIDTDVVYYTDTYETLRHMMNSVYGLPVCKELPPFKFNMPDQLKELPTIMPVPTLSKPPIFNPPATICYWTDGTRTVVKCQEWDIYSPEAGLALCYMKKVLGNTSRDLNKELHKYIPEEKEE